jgi:hypothetical protein
VGKGMDVSFMWQLDVGNIEGACPIKTEFTVHYSPIIDLTKLISENHTRIYRCNFEISDHKVYALHTKYDSIHGKEKGNLNIPSQGQLGGRKLHSSPFLYPDFSNFV